jgi:hypothetical protein
MLDVASTTDQPIPVPVMFCTYERGMFANEKRSADLNFMDVFLDGEAACAHEAAHAVVGYAFGEKIFSVGVCVNYLNVENGMVTSSHSGEVRYGPPGTRRRVDYDYCQLQFCSGVCSAVGPAAELRYRTEAGIPLRILGGSEGDHDAIDSIGKVLENRGRSRYAFRRLVWYSAQRIVNRPDVWEAVCDVTQMLSEEMCNDEPESPPIGKVWSYIPPSHVVAACRRVGIKRGMFLKRSA